MNLLFFTSQYPYEGGESFVEDEINEISKCFDRIVVYSYAKSNHVIRRIPPNAQIVRTRDYETKKIKIMAFIKLFSLRTFKELLFLLRNLRQVVSVKKIHYIYMYYKEDAVIKSLLDKHDYSNDLCYSYWFSTRAYAISNLKRIHPEIKLVCRAHRVDSIPSNYNPFRREILSKIDCIFPISETAKSEIEETERLSKIGKTVNIHVSRLGIKKNDKVVNEIKNCNLFRIVSCSSIIQRKRLDLIIGAIAAIKNTSIKIEWIHFGDGTMRAKIEDLASAKLCNRKNVSFSFRGNTLKDDILKYYAEEQVDVFVNTSDSEGIPVSMMEAMSYGIPCICRNVGGNAEMVVNGVNGYLVESQGILDLSSAIDHVINLSSLERNDMRKKAYETFLKLYNGVDNYRRHASLLKQAFEGSL